MQFRFVAIVPSVSRSGITDITGFTGYDTEHTRSSSCPSDEAFFFVFACKICLTHQSVTPLRNGAAPPPLPKKNPGSTLKED